MSKGSFNFKKKFPTPLVRKLKYIKNNEILKITLSVLLKLVSLIYLVYKNIKNKKLITKK
jgi:hypothetical protein